MDSTPFTTDCPLVMAGAFCSAAAVLLPALVLCGKVSAGSSACFHSLSLVAEEGEAGAGARREARGTRHRPARSGRCRCRGRPRACSRRSARPAAGRGAQAG